MGFRVWGLRFRVWRLGFAGQRGLRENFRQKPGSINVCCIGSGWRSLGLELDSRERDLAGGLDAWSDNVSGYVAWPMSQDMSPRDSHKRSHK